MFATDFKTKRRFTSKAYAAWKAAAGDTLGSQYAAYGSPAVQRPVALHIRLGINYQSDIANREKAITDLLVATLDMPDDRYIDRLVIERDQNVQGAVVTIGTPDDGDARPIGEIIRPIMARLAAGVTE
jgi:hypothetical protein